MEYAALEVAEAFHIPLDAVDRMDAQELGRLAAFLRLKRDRQDAQFGLLAATICNAAGKIYKRHMRAEDFFPRLKTDAGKPVEKLDEKGLDALLRRWVGNPKGPKGTAKRKGRR